MSVDKIKAALRQLNPEDDSHWTGEGLPRLDVMERLSKVGGIKRAMVTEADPEFTRETAVERQEAVEQTAHEEPVEDELERLTEELRVATQEFQAVRKRKEAIQAEVDQEIIRREQARPRQESNRTIRHYLEMQKRARQERVENMRAMQERMKELGGVPQAKAPIDAAMTRQTGHGNKRPNYSGE